jgi:hypothetical protein
MVRALNGVSARPAQPQPLPKRNASFIINFAERE